MKTLIPALAVMLAATACASNRVDFGGVMAPSERPVERVACSEAGWAVDERVSPEYPDQLMTFLYINQDRRDVRELEFTFDINEAGETRNIRFVSPERYLEHRATQSAILAAAEALAQWDYAWEGSGAPVYAEACAVAFSFGAVLYQN